MTNERYQQLMGPDDLPLTAEEIADNWHFCADFDCLLMQAEAPFYNPVTRTCVCGYFFPKPMELQSGELTHTMKPSVIQDTNMHTLQILQAELVDWQRHNFPDRTWIEPYMGVVEEVGELSHHLLKQRQGIRGDYEQHEKEIKDSIADIIVFLTDLCNARGYDMDKLVRTTWAKVSQRDWKANRNDADKIP